MRIAIDISAVIYGTGVSTYTKNLLENLLKIDKDNNYILFGGSLRRLTELENYYSGILNLDNTNLSKKFVPLPPFFANILWNKLHIVPIETFVGKVDTFHSSDWTQPPSSAYKVSTVHDLIPLKYPDMSDPKIVRVHKARFKWLNKEVDKIIVPSRQSADDAQSLGLATEKLVVIPEAVDGYFKPAKKGNINKVKKKYRISGNYFLAVGVSPRKNIERIMEAYDSIRTDTQAKLVVVGYPHSEMNSKRGVIYTGHIERLDLVALYSGAQALVYPTLYEGFGLPILEAFSCRIPVVTSDRGSMSEVAGSAAILVDPYDTNSIRDGMMDAITNSKSLIKRGIKRAKRFSWEKVAKETLKVYNMAK